MRVFRVFWLWHENSPRSANSAIVAKIGGKPINDTGLRPCRLRNQGRLFLLRRLLLILPGVVDVELSPRHKDRTGAIAGNGEPMLLQIPAS